ncbi:MAG: hypothetical protein OXH96_02160 [Spirochaetaceae bacterium]|nr:hypothetical protein [Spirochaetaceae bacterium]
MELALHEAETCLSYLVIAVQSGERVVITRNGEPTVELVRCRAKRGGIDFDKLDADRRGLGIKGDEERWPKEFDDPAFSRAVLGAANSLRGGAVVRWSIGLTQANHWSHNHQAP